MSEDSPEYKDALPFTEVPFDHVQIAEALKVQPERVSDLRNVLPNTPLEEKEKLWRFTLPFRAGLEPGEVVIDINEEEKSANIQMRTGSERDHYLSQISINKVDKVEISNDSRIQFHSEQGLLALVTHGSINISEESDAGKFNGG